ncbi:MAG TPA: hypothetical protein VMD92_12790, partial [Acidobacteriaceae bacterium]|nr:hypothetical protein [Acidobacteriaceae bacterium]
MDHAPDATRPLWQSVLLLVCALLFCLVAMTLAETTPVLAILAFFIFIGRFLVGIGIAAVAYQLAVRLAFPRWAAIAAAVLVCIGVCGALQSVSESHKL